MTPTPRLLRPSEMAQSLHISTQYLRELVSQGHVTCSHRTEGGHRRYTLSDLENARAFLQPSMARVATSDSPPDMDENAVAMRRWRRADELLSLRLMDFQIENAYLARLNELLHDDETGRELQAWVAQERVAIDHEVETVASAIDQLCERSSAAIDEARTETHERARRMRNISLAAHAAILLHVPLALASVAALISGAYVWTILTLVALGIYYTAWNIARQETNWRRKDAMHDLDRQREFDWQVLGRENVQDPRPSSNRASALLVRNAPGPEVKLWYADRALSHHRNADPMRYVPSVWRRDAGPLQTWREMQLRSQEIIKRLGQLERLERLIIDCERYSYRLHETA